MKYYLVESKRVHKPGIGVFTGIGELTDLHKIHAS